MRRRRSSRSPITVSLAICSRSCRSSTRSSGSASNERPGRAGQGAGRRDPPYRHRRRRADGARHRACLRAGRAKFIGMHFMNPVPVMTLVELIRGIATDEATFAATRDLAVKLGKTPVAAEDFPAFIVNRILLPMINEAVYTLYEGVGSVASINPAIKLC